MGWGSGVQRAGCAVGMCPGPSGGQRLVGLCDWLSPSQDCGGGAQGGKKGRHGCLSPPPVCKVHLQNSYFPLTHTVQEAHLLHCFHFPFSLTLSKGPVFKRLPD